MAQTRFILGSVAVHRCGDNLVQLARRYLREAISYEEEMRDPQVSRAMRNTGRSQRNRADARLVIEGQLLHPGVIASRVQQ